MKSIVQFALFCATLSSFVQVGFAQGKTAHPANLTSSSMSFGFMNEARPPTQVTSLIWRSGRPTRETLTELYTSGVRAIINLEDDLDAVNAEIIMAHEIGFKIYSFPTNSFWEPDDAKMNEIVEYLGKSQVPTLVHCLHGEDRTGLVIGLERVVNEKWPAEKAYTEMLAYDFHPILIGLDQYFRDKVGWSIFD